MELNIQYKLFGLKRDAIAEAKYQVSNHPHLTWNKVFKIVKVEVKEI